MIKQIKVTNKTTQKTNKTIDKYRISKNVVKVKGRLFSLRLELII